MDFIVSRHAREQMLRRGINHETVMMVVSHPDQTLADKETPTKIIYQSLIKEENRMFLLRVFVETDKQPNVIITVYKTTKISKYYES
jgi:hypothetical protein